MGRVFLEPTQKTYFAPVGNTSSLALEPSTPLRDELELYGSARRLTLASESPAGFSFCPFVGGLRFVAAAAAVIVVRLAHIDLDLRPVAHLDLERRPVAHRRRIRRRHRLPSCASGHAPEQFPACVDIIC